VPERELVERDLAPTVDRAERVAFAAEVPPDEPELPLVLVEREPADLLAVERVPVERDVVDLARLLVERELLDLARDPVDRDPLELRPLELRDDPEPDDDDPPEEASSVPHLPVITRCAASATASAMMLPSFVALDIMLVAACDAVSAASRPASRILRRALGLALIAAAAAARPAASISLLIAAFAILSIVSLPDEEPDESLLGDFAIVNSSLWSAERHTNGRNGSLMIVRGPHFAHNVKGTAAVQGGDALRHGQRPEVTAVRSAITDGHPFPTSVLNHETSDHLLSLR